MSPDRWPVCDVTEYEDGGYGVVCRRSNLMNFGPSSHVVAQRRRRLRPSLAAHFLLGLVGGFALGFLLVWLAR